MELVVDSTESPVGTVLSVRGELDIATVPILRGEVDKAFAGTPPLLLLDLTPLDFIDSTGCRELVRAAKAGAAAGTPVEVVCPTANKRVRRIVDFMGLGALLPVREQVPTA